MSCSSGNLNTPLPLRQCSSIFRPFRKKAVGKGTYRLSQKTPSPKIPTESNAKAFVLGIGILVFCFIVSWGVYQPAIQQKLSGYLPAASCKSGTAPGPATTERKPEEPNGGFFQHLFCPIVDLPALQGILVPKE